MYIIWITSLISMLKPPTGKAYPLYLFTWEADHNTQAFSR